MQQAILVGYPSEKIRVFVVWIPILPGDSLQAASRASSIFAADERVSQYYDREKDLGLSLARSLGASDGQIAWDVYLFFDQEADWRDQPPVAIEWAHQLQLSKWADAGRLFHGKALSIRLQEIMAMLYQG